MTTPSPTPGAPATGRAGSGRATRRRVPWPLVPARPSPSRSCSCRSSGSGREAPWQPAPGSCSPHPRRLDGAAAVAGLLAVGDACSRRSSASRWPGSWRGRRAPGISCCGRSSRCRWCFPPVVGGLALLLTFGRRGIVGAPLEEWFGVSLPFTTAGVVVAETFVAMPFLVVTLEGAFRSADAGLEEAAATLGASRLVALRTRHPAAARCPASARAPSSRWARALGEFGATITFAGNLPAPPRRCRCSSTRQLETATPRGRRAQPAAGRGGAGRAGARCGTAGSTRRAGAAAAPRPWTAPAAARPSAPRRPAV